MRLSLTDVDKLTAKYTARNVRLPPPAPLVKNSPILGPSLWGSAVPKSLVCWAWYLLLFLFYLGPVVNLVATRQPSETSTLETKTLNVHLIPDSPLHSKSCPVLSFLRPARLTPLLQNSLSKSTGSLRMFLSELLFYCSLPTLRCLLGNSYSICSHSFHMPFLLSLSERMNTETPHFGENPIYLS